MRNPYIMQREVGFNSGNEGPRHDPYGWNEVIVHQRKKRGKEMKIILREGALGYVRLSVNGKIVAESRGDDTKKEAAIYRKFETMTGLTAKIIEKLAYKHYSDVDPMGSPRMYE